MEQIISEYPLSLKSEGFFCFLGRFFGPLMFVGVFQPTLEPAPALAGGCWCFSLLEVMTKCSVFLELPKGSLGNGPN